MLTPKLRNVIARACEVHSHVCSLLASNNVLTVQDHTGRLKPHTLQSPGMLPVWNIHLSPIPKHVGAVPFREPTLRRQLQIVRDKGHLHCVIVDSACILESLPGLLVAPTHSTPSMPLVRQTGFANHALEDPEHIQPCQFSSMTSHCCPSSLGSVWREREWLGL